MSCAPARDAFRSTRSDSTHLEEVSATLSPALKGCAEAIVRVKVAGGEKLIVKAREEEQLC